jgi:Tol biopolymer transport system component
MRIAIILYLCSALWPTLAQAGDLGPFTAQSEIGAPSSQGPGSAQLDPQSQTLTVSGGGANIWAAEDDFHFVWKKASGDITLAANLSFSPATKGAIEHRKAVIMIRQSLDPDSTYADACVHGNGMTALQWRDTKGGISNEVQANANAPKRLQIEKRGSYFSMAIGDSAANLHPAGGACKVDIDGDYYIGIGVCSHSKDRLESALASQIEFGVPPSGNGRTMISTLETCALSSHDRRVVYVLSQSGRFEAPNWGADNMLYFNNKGRLYKIKAQLPSSNPPTETITPEPELIDLGPLNRLNNDHVLSFDKSTIAVSDQSQGNRQSTIWTMPLAGGQPKRITSLTPSYCHGWSPDGKTLVYTGQRENVWDIYAIPAEGGDETRITNTPDREDGPEYSPDGEFIYFNSDRTGLMQIWRMHPDGSAQEQITKDENSNNWFPHVSPNGQFLIYLSYDKSVPAGAHPEGKDVALHLMNLRTGATSIIAKLFGGQGTINVPSWSPDSKCFAFVSYQSAEK